MQTRISPIDKIRIAFKIRKSLHQSEPLNQMQREKTLRQTNQLNRPKKNGRKKIVEENENFARKNTFKIFQ